MSETSKAHERRIRDGFYEYLQKNKFGYYKEDPKILDIGYAGTGGQTFPGFDVVGLDKNTPGYDGIRLPYEDESFDIVYSSHLLEHLPDSEILYREHIREQFRILCHGGFLIAYVPHMELYEKKTELPSQFNLEHRRFYTPARLLQIFEEVLNYNHDHEYVMNQYRVRRCQDCDEGFDYSLPPEIHSVGEYSIEVVLEKL